MAKNRARAKARARARTRRKTPRCARVKVLLAGPALPRLQSRDTPQNLAQSRILDAAQRLRDRQPHSLPHSTFGVVLDQVGYVELEDQDMAGLVVLVVEIAADRLLLQQAGQAR